MSRRSLLMVVLASLTLMVTLWATQPASANYLFYNDVLGNNQNRATSNASAPRYNSTPYYSSSPTYSGYTGYTTSYSYPVQGGYYSPAPVYVNPTYGSYSTPVYYYSYPR